MSRFRELEKQFNRTVEQINQLNEEYDGHIKGEIFRKRKAQLIKKQKDIQTKARNIGVTGNICHIHGKRTRPSRKSPNVIVQETFNLYFVNISEEEAPQLAKLHVKNIISMTIKFIQPGVMITSS